MRHLEEHLGRRDVVALTPPTYYEVLRGLTWKKAHKKLIALRTRFVPRFDWIPLQDEDWIQAALFWSDAVSAGRQLSDMDFLLAALAHRLDAIIVSSDAVFDALPVKRDDWRTQDTNP
jgi:predicted nucleic acid-binding protein